jgi:hypothetical protein
MKNVMRLESNRGRKQSEINLGTLASVLVLSLLCPLREVRAAGLANPVYKIEIEYKAHNKQAPAEATVTMPDKTSGILDSIPTRIIVPSASTPRLEVVNANPVLFSYGIDDVSVQQNQTNKVLEDFLSKLSGLMPSGGDVSQITTDKALGGIGLRSTFAEATEAPHECRIDKVNGVDVNTFFFTTRPTVAKLLSVAPGTASDNGNNLPKAIEDISINPTPEAQRSLEDAISEINALGSFFDDQEGLERIKNDPMSDIKIEYSGTGGTACPKSPSMISGLAKLKTIKSIAPATWVGLNPEQLYDEIFSYILVSQKYSDAFNLATDLSKEAANIGKTFPLKPKDGVPIVVDYAHDSTVTFSIAKNNKYVPLLTPATKDFQNEVSGLGKKSVAMTIENEYSVTWAPGAAYSFVQNPQYAVTSKNGQLVISETSNDYNKLSPAIVFNISRSKYEGQSMTPHLQVGVIPESNNLGFLFGGGFHSGGNLSFALGIVYQKATALKAGLSVGQVVANTADLQTESKYKTGLYFSIGYDVVPKK